MTKREKREQAEREERRRQWIEREAQHGSAAVRYRINYERVSLTGLLNPRGWTNTGRKHEHAEPFDTTGCGWCGNIRHAREHLAVYEAALPRAIEIEAALDALAVELPQSRFVPSAQVLYAHMTRDQLRGRWHLARSGRVDA